MKTKYAFLLLLLCAAIFAFRMDDDPFDAILKKLADYNEALPQEKVHLHLDKPYYAIGDDIWFKAYVINSRSNELSDISSALYVELIDGNDSVKKQIKLPLVSGITWGDFKLKDTLQEGNYRIRAYTQWMRNAGPDYFFDKTIKIGNAWANRVFTSTSFVFGKKEDKDMVTATTRFSDKQGMAYADRPVTYEVLLKDKIVAHGKGITNAQGDVVMSFKNSAAGTTLSGKIQATITLANKQEIVKTIPVKATLNAISIQLFPEGGSLVENLPSRVGVKAINSAGLGEDIAGSILDSDGTEVLTFNTSHLGMGNFMINPQAGKTYTLKATLKDGSTQVVLLPKAAAQGYVLSVNNTDSAKVNAKVLISAGMLDQGDMKVVVQKNNVVLAVLRPKTTKQVTSFSLAKKDLPSGILHLTLFSTANVPVAERLIFINNPAELLHLELGGLKGSYAKRENVPLELFARDGNQPTQGSFSVAVTNNSIVTPDPESETNILTSMLLSADLKGYIEKPNYYLLHQDKTTLENLDNLMLTQGWTKLTWAEVMGTPIKAPLYPAEHMLKVTGTITTTGGKPVAQGKVSLFSTSGGLFMIDTLTDDKGHFAFNNLVFGDSTRFVVQARNAKNKKYVEINLDMIPGQVVTRNKNTGDIEVNVNEAIRSYVQQSEKYFNDQTRRGLLEHTLLLDQVNIVQKKNPAKNSSNLNGAGNADAVINAKDLSTCVLLSQCLQGRIAGLTIRNGLAYLLRNNGTPMQIVLDGVNMDTQFSLDDIQPFDIETIEVLKSISNTSIYGSRGAGGVLIITTKRGGGDLSYSRYAPGIITYSPKGYYAIRQFYSPQYTPGNTLAGEDRRTTVYWNPHVPTEANGKAKFNFYNTDETGTYRVVIEGINAAGHLARGVYTYEVK